MNKAVYAVKIVLMVGLVLSGAGCGDDSSAADPAGTGFEPAFDCEGLADRWVVIHQAYLDDLGDLPASELDPAGPVANRAAQSLAMAVIEQGRDAENVGCADRLVSGSPLLCARLHRLSAHGEAGDVVLAQLGAACAPD